LFGYLIHLGHNYTRLVAYSRSSWATFILYFAHHSWLQVYPLTYWKVHLTYRLMNPYHTTKIKVTSVISHFVILVYYKKPIPLKYHIFWLCDNTKYHISKLVTLQKLNYLYNIAPLKYIILIFFIWRLVEIYFSTFCSLWIFLIKKYSECVA